MSRKNRSKKNRWSRRRRRLMRGDSKMPLIETTALPEIDDGISTSNILRDKTKSQKNHIAPPEIVLGQFDEAKQKEIRSHLKTVLSVSALCLVLVGTIYFLELKMGWIEKILGMSL